MKNKLNLLTCVLGASLSLGAVAFMPMPNVNFSSVLNEPTTVFARRQGGDAYTKITSLGSFQKKRFRPASGYMESLGFAAGDAIEVMFQNSRGSSKTCQILRLYGGHLSFVMSYDRTDASLTLERAHCTIASDAGSVGSQVELSMYQGSIIGTQLLVKTLGGEYKTVTGPSVAHSTVIGWKEKYVDIDLQPALKDIRLNEYVIFAVTNAGGRVFQCGYETIFQGEHSFVFDGHICMPR